MTLTLCCQRVKGLFVLTSNTSRVRCDRRSGDGSAMSRNTVEHVIRRFGSQQRVAELLGIWQTAVSGWVRRGAIPARRQEELLAIARREGLELAPGRLLRRAGAVHGSRRRRPRRQPRIEPPPCHATGHPRRKDCAPP